MIQTICRWLIPSIVFLVASASSHGDPALPRGTPLVTRADLERFVLEGPSAAPIGKLAVVPANGQPFDRALRLATSADATVEWDVQASLTTTFAVRKDDVLLAHFWARCVDSMTGQGHVGFVFEQNRDPYAKAVDFRLDASSEWIECFVPFKADRDYAAGAAHVVLRGGYERQTMEIGGVELTNYGDKADLATLPRTRISYAGRAADAAWRVAANARIEKLRKAELTIHASDAAGRSVANATVHAKLVRHAFGFGSCVTLEQLTGTSADDERCRAFIAQHFNRVVFENDMKWPAMYEGVPPALDRAVAWLGERRIDIRGHNLIWPGWEWLPPQLRAFERDPAALRKRCEDRVTSAVSHFRGKLIEWDVVNEPYTNRDLFNLLGGDAVMVDWYRRARAADPACKLYLNDFGIFDGGAGNAHRKHFYDTIKMLRDAGASLDGIGIQSHFGAALPPPEQLLAVLDQFAEFGLPIESTELSLNVLDRDLQADYLRDYMTALFSHPSVNAIMLWGFWEGSHWRPDAALFTRDWTARPIGDAWLDLVTKRWSTDVTLMTDANGNATTRGFLGEYEVSANGSEPTRATLQPGGMRVNVVAR